jgi:hypothetical protein
MSGSDTIDSTRACAANLAARLRGQTITIPNILALYDGWTVRKHAAIDMSPQDLEEFFRVYIPTEDQRARARKVDSTFCAGVFFTRCSTEKFMVLRHWIAWSFFWDDEVDDSLLRQNTPMTNAYIDDSIAFVRYYMQPELNTPPPTPGRLHNCGPWVNMAEAMLIGQSLADRNRYAESIIDFFEIARGAHVLRTVGVDALDTYLERRVRNVGSTQCLTVMPWAYDLDVPSWVWEHEAMTRIIREIAHSVSLGNDIASLQKELKINEVNSIIPILVLHQNISAQQAANTALSMMAQSWEDILDAKSRLRHAVRMEEDLIQRHVNILLDAFMDVLIGHVAYIWHTRRYLSKDVFDGSSHGFTVVL